MRWWSAISLLCAMAACRFDHAAAPDEAVDLDAAAGTDPAPLVCPMNKKRVWLADFTADPTTLNVNGDPVTDWRIRDGGGLPGQLTDGVWSIGGAPMVSLDTQPKTDFNRLLRASARMRNTESGARGVMLWLNADYSPMTFAPLFVEVRLDGDHQSATLFTKTVTAEVPLATFTDLGTGMIDVSLDVDPMPNTVTVTVDAMTSTHVYVPIPRNMNDDRFATLAAYSAGEFDDARVELCQ